MLPFQQGFLELVDVAYKSLVGLASIVAIVSLFKWRFELIGRNKFTIARRIILLALRYREEYENARGVIYDSSEYADRKKTGQDTKEVNEALDMAYLKDKRLRPLRITHRQLHEAGWEAETILGTEIAELIQPFEDSFYHLEYAVDAYYKNQLMKARGLVDVTETYLDMEQMAKVVWGWNDELSKEIDNHVNRLKESLKKYVQ